jgi:cell division protein FtsB
VRRVREQVSQGKCLMWILTLINKLFRAATALWSEQMKTLDAKYLQLQRDHAQLQADIELMRARTSALHAENTTLRHERDELLTQREDLATFVEGLQRELDDAKKRIAGLPDAAVVREAL